MASVLVISGGAVSVSADSVSQNDRAKRIEEARTYMTKSSSELSVQLEKLKEKGVVSYEDVKGTIDHYYAINPAPADVEKDSTITLNEIFPEEVKKLKAMNKEDVFDVNDFIEEKKKENEVISFTTSNGSVDVFINKVGIFIGENEILGKSEQETKNNSVMAASWSYTPNQRYTGHAYNGLGKEEFSMWVSGSFKYNNSDVQVATSDGNYDRYLWGATLTLTSIAMGAPRIVNIEGYKYAEAYSRLRCETTLGIGWFGTTVNSSTVEVKIGSTIAGNVYTGGQVV